MFPLFARRPLKVMIPVVEVTIPEFVELPETVRLFVPTLMAEVELAVKKVPFTVVFPPKVKVALEFLTSKLLKVTAGAA